MAGPPEDAAETFIERITSLMEEFDDTQFIFCVLRQDGTWRQRFSATPANVICAATGLLNAVVDSDWDDDENVPDS